MTEPTDSTPDFVEPGEPIFSFNLDREGVADARLLGGHPRVVAHMLRHVADSLDDVADELELPPLETCSGHAAPSAVIASNTREGLDEARAEFDRKRQAAKLS